MKATIVGTEERTDYTILNRPRQWVTVRYMTEKGSQGSLEIAKEEYTPEVALQRVAEDVARVHSVVGMSTE